MDALAIVPFYGGLPPNGTSHGSDALGQGNSRVRFRRRLYLFHKFKQFMNDSAVRLTRKRKRYNALQLSALVYDTLDMLSLECLANQIVYFSLTW